MMSLLGRRTTHSSRGDTIVEVLIAIAVVSSVLAGAFLVSQKSSIAVRDSQEHAEVAQLLQSQVEQVRSLALAETSDTTGVYATSPQYFCIGTSGANAGKRVDFPGSVTPGETTLYPTDCRQLQSLYAVAITYDAPSKVFRFIANWDAVGGGMGQEEFLYRIFPAGLASVSSPGPSPAPAPGPSPAPGPIPPNCVAVTGQFVGDISVTTDSGNTAKIIPLSGSLPGGCNYNARITYGDTHASQSVACAAGDIGACQIWHQSEESFFTLGLNGTSLGSPVVAGTRGPASGYSPDVPDGSAASGFGPYFLNYSISVPAGQTVQSLRLEHAPLVSPTGASWIDGNSVHIYGVQLNPI